MSSSSSAAVVVDDQDLSSYVTIEDINNFLIPSIFNLLSEAQKFLHVPESNQVNHTDNNNNNIGNKTEEINTKSGSSDETSKLVNENGRNRNEEQSNTNTNTAGGDDAGGSCSSISCFTTTATTTTKRSSKTTNQTQNECNQDVVSNTNGGNRSLSLHHRHLHLNGQLEKLRSDLNYVKESFQELRRYEDNVNNPFKAVLLSVKDIVREVTETPQGSLRTNDVQTKLRELNKIVTNLKLHVPSAAHKTMSSANSNAQQRFPRLDPSVISNGFGARNLFDGLRSITTNDHFRRSAGFSDIKEIYDGLKIDLKLCLLCFSIFPENAEVHRRVLLYWWIGEGLIVPPSGSPSTGEKKTVEDVADEILQKLVTKGFIEPVNKKRRLVADSFKMHPFIRSVVITLAKEAEFFDFDNEGNPTAKFRSSHRACLTREGSSNWLSTNKDQVNPEQLYTLFNVSEQYLKLEPDWFSKLKNVYVLQLGRWQSSAKHHIEVEDTEFLKRLKNLRLLMFLSLQGISRIMELPATICRLINLRILDLRACHSLEVLPEEIAMLKNLTHLDMSECYLLENMPKGIASLTELQVLKGFVIGDPKSRSPCTLNDLISLNNLRKLSISTGWEAFPTDKDVNALKQFQALCKLKIAWGGSSIEQLVAANTKIQDNKGNRATAQATLTTTKSRLSRTLSKMAAFKKDKATIPDMPALPQDLEKLDLQCFPHRKRPSWLNPSKLTSLKKLYIRGGTLGNLCYLDDKWNVEILRLKYLYELKMNWIELQASFPHLTYLEKVKCSKLTFFPCNERGVWLKEHNGTEAVASK